jgi:predicted RNase H-like HicB family nuclease
MDTNTLNLPTSEVTQQNHTKHNYNILIEQKGEEHFTATVLGCQQLQTEGKTKEEALEKLRQLLTTKVENAEIVSLEIDFPQAEHPWMKFAGMFKDDPDFDDFLADIEAYRKEIDAEMEEYYRQMDAEEE